MLAWAPFALLAAGVLFGPIALRRSLPLGNPVGWRLVFRAVHRRHDQARRKAAAAEPPLPGRQSKADVSARPIQGLMTGYDRGSIGK